MLSGIERARGGISDADCFHEGFGSLDNFTADDSRFPDGTTRPGVALYPPTRSAAIFGKSSGGSAKGN
jgi:hypothetical protein